MHKAQLTAGQNLLVKGLYTAHAKPAETTCFLCAAVVLAAGFHLWSAPEAALLGLSVGLTGGVFFFKDLKES